MFACILEFAYFLMAELALGPEEATISIDANRWLMWMGKGAFISIFTKALAPKVTNSSKPMSDFHMLFHLQFRFSLEVTLLTSELFRSIISITCPGLFITAYVMHLFQVPSAHPFCVKRCLTIIAIVPMNFHVFVQHIYLCSSKIALITCKVLFSCSCIC